MVVSGRFLLWCSTISLLFLVAGCGSVGSSIKEGDMLKVAGEIRERATVTPDETNGFDCIIPAGTVLRVMDKPNLNSGLLNVQVVSVNGNSDWRAIESQMVPDYIKELSGYKGFYFTLPSDYVGSKLTVMKK